jgi:gliding motility-associated-like protein
MRSFTGSFYLYVILSIIPGSLQAQLVINSGFTPEQLVQNTLIGPGVSVSNVTFNGLPGSQVQEQLGRFLGSDCVLALDSGLIMCTGNIDVALGPNDWSSAFIELFGDEVWDEDINNVAGDWCMDNAILEFDFVPQGDSISFAYSFASEEYLEYVNAGYNDAFGFFLSGPGITGPFQNDAMNLAVVPGTMSYVSVNSVHPGSNAQYYQDNGTGNNSPYSTNPYYFQFDGFTVGLTAGATVQCGQTYHIKMAIGDVGDPNWDSGVFIQGGTFTSTGGGGVEIVTSTGNETVTEGCDTALVTISRAGMAGNMTVQVTTTGTATAATDLIGYTGSVTIPDGQSSVSFPIGFAADVQAEGSETITLCAEISGACGSTASCATLNILDAPLITLTGSDATSDCSGGDLTLTAEASGGTGSLAFAWSTGSDQASITVPDGAANYNVSVTDECGVQASLTLAVIAPCGIEVPNVFTPNGDGTNDVFEITGIESLSNVVRVSNRWGQVVFEAVNYRNNWAGANVSDGTYFYVVMADGLTAPLTGHLTILASRN